MPKTANQKLFEEAVRHHVQLLRFGEAQADMAMRILAEAEQELLDKIIGAMARGLEPSRLEVLLDEVRARRQEVYAGMQSELEDQLAGLAQMDSKWEAMAIQNASPVYLNMAAVPAETLRAVVLSPINGIALEGWVSSMAAREMQSLQQAVNMAMLQGETIDDLVRRIRGTRANNFQDGILSTTTRNAQALARTAVSHVSNQAREAVWEANADIVRALRWTATLDGRTSTLCAGRDGKMTPVGTSSLLPSDPMLYPPGARPPAHFNCRSVMVAVLDGVALAGNRPFVADARVRSEREADFRRLAKAEGTTMAEQRRKWADKNVGSLPADTDYTAWLKSQSSGLQDEILGPARAKMFREGTPLERFNDVSGRRLTLDELHRELGL